MAGDGIELSPTRQAPSDTMTMESPVQHRGNHIDVQPAINGSEDPELECRRIQVFAIMVALCLSLFIAALDQTIVSTSLPTISSRFHSASGYTWVGGAYLLASAAAAPIRAKLSDIWGRKPNLLVAVLWFLLSSIVCAAAVNMKMLIAGRALQGIAGGGLLQLVMIVVSDLFNVRRRSLYMGILEFMWTISGGLGPILGGVFSEYLSWRWNFWINLPMTIFHAKQAIPMHSGLMVLPLVELVIFQVIGGAGSAILFAPPLIALQALVAQDDTASATTMLGFIHTIAMSVSIVVGGVVFQSSMTGERGRLQAAGLADGIVEELTGASAAASTEVIKTLKDPSKIRIVADAFSSSLQNIWIIYTYMAGIAVLASMFIVNQPLSEEHTETRTGLKEE
ncbi:major facilitator superfamily domain-containing protein [Aspergillus bertholletiae]|uniref:Major facilitator superfamily domain-containing protein n=1 Tax=Aspergillus bertholletiae TaxID=1226010 RepID=A0A5N7B8H2_9EURO|nr:major facilitator superfamily domain-containing protein [Aspergillus bertholletiae]